jgi:hypothetical protein
MYRPLQVSHIGVYGEEEDTDMINVNIIGTRIITERILANERV